MRIDKLHLQDFGQFHNKDMTLAPGINVIYGANEAGKSTMKDFIMDMFYGIDKARGIGARFDHYEQKKPINGAAFSGSMEITTDQGQYMIERNFSRHEKSVVVRDLDTGRELPLQEENSILGTVLHTEKSVYLNTLCIDQLGAATDKAIAERLNNYIVNMASTKTGEIDAVSAIMSLKEKKKEYSVKDLEQKQQELVAKLDLDRDFDAELAAIQEEYRKTEATMKSGKQEHLEFSPINPTQEPKEEEQDEEAEEEVLTKEEKELQMLKNMGPKSILDNLFVILFIALLFVALFVGIAQVVPINDPMVKMCIMGAGILLVGLTTIQGLIKRAHLHRLLEELEIEQSFQEAKESTVNGVDQTQMVQALSELKVKEKAIVEQRVEQEQLMKEINEIKNKIANCQTELAALDLAMNTIQDISEEIYDSFGSVLNKQVSDIVAKITKNKYTEVRIDDQLRVMVKSGSSFISMEYLSVGTIEQIYLALRLSIANVLVGEDLPIVIDDIFVTYDYQRLSQTLGCIGEYMNRQIIIFTANPGIHDMFNNLGIANTYMAI